MQKEKQFNKYRINTKDNKFRKILYLLRTEVKKAIQKSSNFKKVREHKLYIAKKEINTLKQYDKNIKKTNLAKTQISQMHANNSYKTFQISKRSDL